MIGMNMKKTEKYWVSNYLGEFQALVWALKDVCTKIHVARVCIHTDSQSVFHQLNNYPRKGLAEDIQVMRLVARLWDNFTVPSKLRIEFVPGDINVSAYLLSRWYENKEHISSAAPGSREPSWSQLQLTHSHGRWKGKKLVWIFH